MGLFHAVNTFTGAIAVFGMLFITICVFVWIVSGFYHFNMAWLIVRHFAKADRSNILQFTVMTSMGHNFVRV